MPAIPIISRSESQNIRKAENVFILRAEDRSDSPGLRSLRHASKRRKPKPGSKNGAVRRRRPLSRVTLTGFVVQQRKRTGRDTASAEPILPHKESIKAKPSSPRYAALRCGAYGSYSGPLLGDADYSFDPRRSGSESAD